MKALRKFPSQNFQLERRFAAQILLSLLRCTSLLMHSVLPPNLTTADFLPTTEAVTEQARGKTPLLITPEPISETCCMNREDLSDPRGLKPSINDPRR